jgi:hypothetical protein
MEATRSRKRMAVAKSWLDEALVILLVVAALLLGFALKVWVEGRAVSFATEDGAVSLQYPARWLRQNEKDTLLTVSDVRAVGWFKPRFSLLTREMNPDYPLTESDVLVSLSVQRAQELTAYRVLKVDQGSVDGLEASSLSYTYVSEPTGTVQAALPAVIEAVDRVVMVGGKAYIFSFAATADEFPQELAVFQSILDSVDFR